MEWATAPHQRWVMGWRLEAWRPKWQLLLQMICHQLHSKFRVMMILNDASSGNLFSFPRLVIWAVIFLAFWGVNRRFWGYMKQHILQSYTALLFHFFIFCVNLVPHCWVLRTLGGYIDDVYRANVLNVLYAVFHCCSKKVEFASLTHTHASMIFELYLCWYSVL